MTKFQVTKLSLKKYPKTLVTPYGPSSIHYLDISTSTRLLSFQTSLYFTLDSEACNFLHKADRSQFKT